jgi:type II secretory pathway component PulC
LHSPQQATAEPGGFEVPAHPAPEWTALGLVAGDVIRYINGQPAGDRMMMGEGVTMLEIDRRGKRVFLRVVVHGKPVRALTLTQHAFDRIVEISKGTDLATPVQQGPRTSGVRILDMLLSLHAVLSPGDIVRTIDGTAILSQAELATALQNLRIGTTAIAFERDGREIRLEITRNAALDFTQIKKHGATKFEVPRQIVTAIDADSELVTGHVKLVPATSGGKLHGVRLVDIEPGSLCAALGLVDGDIVLDADGRSLDSMEDAFRAEMELANEPTITLHVERRGKPLSLVYSIR